MSEEVFELGLHHAVKDALLGAAAGVEPLARAARRCVLGGKQSNLDMHARRDRQSLANPKRTLRQKSRIRTALKQAQPVVPA